MIVDEPQGAYYGGVVAAPIAKEIFQKIFEYDNQISNSNSNSGEAKFKLDSFIGLSLTQAASKIASQNLQYLIQGNGERVTGQIPAPDVEVNENDIILLMFE